MEQLFSTDCISKRERVERTLKHTAVDRVALHEQLSYNPAVIAWYTGKPLVGFQYTIEDICSVIRQTLDMCFPPVAPRGTGRITTADGFVIQQDNWTSWHVSRPFTTAKGACGWLQQQITELQHKPFSADAERRAYHDGMRHLQRLVGDTVILNYSGTGFAGIVDAMGLELFTYFYEDYPEVFAEYLSVSTQREIQRIHAVADRALSPLILIPEDFATKQGPIFSPEFLTREHFPHVKALTDAWHAHGIAVLYHSDGNYKKVIPNLMACGVDGFYCLEPSCGMDIVELKTAWPQMVWAGGVDGVDLMERGTPEQVRAEVHRHIGVTHALETGGMFVASSSEINPPIPPENYRALVEAVGEQQNSSFQSRR